MAQNRSISLGGVTNLAVLAPIKNETVTCFEPITYLKRLRKVLDALNASRQNVRESELWQPIFPDSVGQFGIIHHFRYALVPPLAGVPAQEQPPDGWKLSLNVTFDGGWEPYMRVIFRDIGPLLDLLFCHSPDYPGSRTSSFDEYCKWVRDNEIFGGTFYSDSGMSLQDHKYLAMVEKAQREASATDADFARMALPSAVKQHHDAMAQASKDRNALVLPLRTLKGLYRLSTYFPRRGPSEDPAGDKSDEGILRRFAQSVLQGPIEVMQALDKMSEPPGDWVKAKVGFADELAWLDYPNFRKPGKALPQPCVPANLQSHILGAGENITHGCVVLLRTMNPAKALPYLKSLRQKCGLAPVHGSDIGYLVAFTYAGLQRLGISQKRLDKMPPEFAEGMEARCGLLGDVRGNHPDRWARPVAYGQQASGQRVDMKTVDVLIQLRREDPGNTSHSLHADFDAVVNEMNHQETTGLRVLAVQPTRSYRSNGVTVGHLDFADGISQPKVLAVSPAGAPVAADRDTVSAGELLLGYANERGDGPRGPVDPLQMDGSFLVVRKLRQHMDRLDALLPDASQEQRKELLEKMMGRKPDGTPLALPEGGPTANDFDYGQPHASDACPFHSHIRRANPRDGRPYTPRILRRGMSYGPKSPDDRTTERGVIFMAYCAGIAEQFETIQRWVAGGNSSGVGSAQADPFLRVPQAGEKSTFRYLDSTGQVARAVFDDQALVQLEWGLYLFVPGLEALEKLDSLLADPPGKAPAHAGAAPLDELERVRRILEDPDTARKAWGGVRAGEASEREDLRAYGTLLGTAAEVLRVMRDDGRKYSVQGYRERMELSGGANLLGLDPGDAYTGQHPVKDALFAMTQEEAFARTFEQVPQILGRFPILPGDPVRRAIDLQTFSDAMMAALCRIWVGLPQPPYMVPGGRKEGNCVPPRCPGNMMTVSRYLFPPHPRTEVQEAGQQQGIAACAAVQEWLEKTGQAQLGSLAKDIKSRLLAKLPDGAAKQLPDRSLALVLAGVMQGFTPTVQGNFFRTMENWIEHETLWQHQQALFEASPDVELTYEQAEHALLVPLFATMRQRPVPDMMWRSPVTEKELDSGVVERVVDTDPGNRVVLGITSALTDPAAPAVLMFGRDSEDDKTNSTIHGCPGYRMGVGVLLGMIGGLLKAGTLRPTGSPVLLILTPNTPMPPSP